MKKIIMIAGLAVFCFSCNKKTVKQFSYWKINGQEYSSNHVAVSETKGGSSLTETNGLFALRFGLMYLPAQDMYLLRHPTNNPDYASLVWSHNNIVYTIARDSVLLTYEQVNGKARFILSPAWFKSGTLNDSVLIEATFNAP